MQEGFSLEEVEVEMICNLKHYQPPPMQTSKLTVKRCVSLADFQLFAHIFASVMPQQESIARFYEAAAQIPDTQIIQHYIGYARQQPVTVASLFHTDIIGIYDLITHPAEQRQGYGRMMMQHLLDLAKRMKYRQAALLCSPRAGQVLSKL